MKYEIFKEIPDYYNQSCGFCNKPVNFKKLTDAYRSGDNGSPYTDKESYYSVMYGCPNCEKQSLIVFGSIAVSGGRTFFYKTQFPKYSPIRMADVPEEIEKDRFEAWNCYFNGCFKSSAIMARAALQRAVRKLEAEGKGLYNEIENLKDKSVITKQLADFAHEVRITGNDFAHPDEISEVNQKEVEESLDFLDGFLEMVFVLPLVAERRKKARLESQK